MEGVGCELDNVDLALQELTLSTRIWSISILN